MFRCDSADVEVPSLLFAQFKVCCELNVVGRDGAIWLVPTAGPFLLAALVPLFQFSLYSECTV
jgi:hypothetical protein